MFQVWPKKLKQGLTKVKDQVIGSFWYLLPKNIGINIHQAKSNYKLIYRSSYKLIFRLWPIIWGHRGHYMASWRWRISLKAIFDIFDLNNLRIDIHKPFKWCFDFGLHFEAKEGFIEVKDKFWGYFRHHWPRKPRNWYT